MVAGLATSPGAATTLVADEPDRVVDATTLVVELGGWVVAQIRAGAGGTTLVVVAATRVVPPRG